MKKFTVYSLQLTVIFILYTLYFILTPFVYAGHEVGTEGKYCDGSEIWLDLPDGSHEYSNTDCTLSGQVCKMFPSEGLTADAVCENPPPPPPPPPTPTPSPKIPTPDEIALERKNQGLLPPEISSQIKPKDESLFSKIGDLFKQIFSIFGFTPASKETFSANAEIQKQTEIPSEIQSSSESNILEQTSQNLGEDAGIYSVAVPKEINQGSENTQDFEKTYQNANFPEGITPITGL